MFADTQLQLADSNVKYLLTVALKIVEIRRAAVCLIARLWLRFEKRTKLASICNRVNASQHMLPPYIYYIRIFVDRHMHLSSLGNLDNVCLDNPEANVGSNRISLSYNIVYSSSAENSLTLSCV